MVDPVVTVASRWFPDRALLVTELRGPVDIDAVAAWRAGLHAAVKELPSGARFKLLLDLRGYEPTSLDAHREMRMVVPRLLATHGLRPAFTDLFAEAPEPIVTAERDVVCVAFANVHHDDTKMDRYEDLIATGNQRFFTSRSAAEEWLDTV